MTIPEPFSFQKWIDDNEADLKPPVNNKVMFPDDKDFIVQVVGGPNVRTDFHYEPFAEWFYQIKGNMHVIIMEDGKPRRVDIKEGETWMLPPNTSHSPQRPEEGSIGLVVEKIRAEGELEKFQWFCPECHHLVWEVELQVRDIVKDMPPVFEEFYGRDDAGRTCPNCGAVHPGRAAARA